MKILFSFINSPQEPSTEPTQDTNKPVIKSEKNAYQKVDNSTNPPTLINRYMVKRTMNASATHIEVRECLAEKVTSRRMNPKRNTYEYFVKWSDFESTWEPRSHFEKAQELILECERKLASKGKPTVTTTTAVQQVATTAASPAVVNAVAGGGIRPARGSKARAVDTMKQWTGEGSDLKRKNMEIDDGAETADADSSQDEGSPKKMQKTSPQVVQRVVGGQVRYYQKVSKGLHEKKILFRKLSKYSNDCFDLN